MKYFGLRPAPKLLVRDTSPDERGEAPSRDIDLRFRPVVIVP